MSALGTAAARIALAARATLLVALLPLLPRAAEACAVCMSGREDDTGRALLKGTLLLSILPLAMLGGILLYLRRRSERGRT